MTQYANEVWEFMDQKEDRNILIRFFYFGNAVLNRQTKKRNFNKSRRTFRSFFPDSGDVSKGAIKKGYAAPDWT